MPAAYTIAFRAPERSFEPRFEDLHQLACWLVEGPGRQAHAAQRKPFALWPLHAHDGEVELRLNWLLDERLPRRRLEVMLERGPRLDELTLDMTGLSEETVTYARLARLEPIRQCDFQFLSATYFSRSGRDYLLPDPELIVRTLVSRWNECVGQDSPLRVSDEAGRDLGRQIVLEAHDLHTVWVEAAQSARRRGFVGQARLGLLRKIRAQEDAAGSAQLFAALCAFAPFCGLGAQTTHGLGAVRTFQVDG